MKVACGRPWEERFASEEGIRDAVRAEGIRPCRVIRLKVGFHEGVLRLVLTLTLSSVRLSVSWGLAQGTTLPMRFHRCLTRRAYTRELRHQRMVVQIIPSVGLGTTLLLGEGLALCQGVGPGRSAEARWHALDRGLLERGQQVLEIVLVQGR